MSEMSNIQIEQNGVNGTGNHDGEGVAPGRFEVVEPASIGRNQETVRKEKEWKPEDNRLVWECYIASEPGKRGFMERMENLWIEKDGRRIGRKSLRAKVQHIEKRNILTKTERDEIERRLNGQESENDEGGENLPESEEGEENGNENVRSVEKENDHDNVRVVLDRIDVAVVGGEPRLLNEEDKKIMQRIREIFNSNADIVIPSLKTVPKVKVNEETKKVNSLIGNFSTKNITETNKLMCAAAFVVAERLGKTLKKKKTEKKEPWWKRRIEKNIIDWRKDLSKLVERRKGKNKLTEGETINMNRRYSLEDKGNNYVIDMLKNKITNGSEKIKRYKKRMKQYHENTLFKNSQKKFYEELNGGREENAPPRSEEAVEFWKGIWSKPVKHNGNAEWLEEARANLGEVQKQNDIVIVVNDVKVGTQKMSSWNGPGEDGLQGFWFKSFSSLHQRICDNFNECLRAKCLPKWLTLGRTVLIQKDKTKGNAASNYRPITCLPLAWKLFTGIIAEKTYEHLKRNFLLPEEQKGCRKQSRGTKDQLLIDKMILKHCKRKQRALGMAWVDFKKAYDMVPHSWLIETMNMVGMAGNVVELLRYSMKQWKTQLTCNGKKLGEVDIKRGIFQGDSLSPLLFVIVLIPLSIVLRKTEMGYQLKKNDRKINHLLFMDDLKLYGKNEQEINALVQLVRIMSKDVGMEFGIEKCAVLVMKRGVVVQNDGIVLPDDQVIKNVDESGYKYLGIIQQDGIMNGKMKAKTKEEYFRRVKKIAKSNLYSGNVIAAINAWAIGVIRYGAGIIDWTKEELKEMDIKTRKIMSMKGALHVRSSVNRLYLKRKEGGRGLIGVEECVESEKRGLSDYLRNSDEWMLRMALEEKVLEETETAQEYKDRRLKEKKTQWKSKALHGKFIESVEGLEGVDMDKTWAWVKSGYLTKETEGLIMAAQEQSLRTRSVKALIDKTEQSPLCRLCGKTSETSQHIASGCPVLAKRKYLMRHDQVGKQVHWELCKKFDIEVSKKWYQHVPGDVMNNANEDVTIYWNKIIETDRKIKSNRPDIVVFENKIKKWTLIDIAIPMDHRVVLKEQEKREIYSDLAAELRRSYIARTEIIPIIVGSMGTIPKGLSESFENLGIPDITNSIQITALLGTAAILRRVLSI